jgi:hypothetical protein
VLHPQCIHVHALAHGGGAERAVWGSDAALQRVDLHVP